MAWRKSVYFVSTLAFSAIAFCCLIWKSSVYLQKSGPEKGQLAYQATREYNMDTGSAKPEMLIAARLDSNKGNAKEFLIFAFLERYSRETRIRLLQNGVRDVKLLTTSNIDSDNDGYFEEHTVRAYLKRKFPDSTESGLCIIDWEKMHYKNLKLPSHTNRFQKAEAEFIKLIRLVKHERPNLSVGIYGLPFRVYINRYPSYNQQKKFSRILNECDVITPSFYLTVTNAQVGGAVNKARLKNNLIVNLEYGLQLKKPVMPFIWEIVHPQNEMYGGGLVPQSEFLNMFDYIIRFELEGIQVDGVIWWAPGRPPAGYGNLSSLHGTIHPFRKNVIENEQSVRSLKHVRDSLMVEYVKYINDKYK